MTEKIEIDDKLTNDTPNNDVKSSQSGFVQVVSRTVWCCTVAVLGVVFVTSVATWFASWHWLADLCANLRVQQMIGLMGLLVVAVVFRRKGAITVCIVLMAVHLPMFRSSWGRSQAYETTVQNNDSDLVVMTANVWTPNTHHDLIVQQIEKADADVFAILELGAAQHRHLETALAESYPHQFAFPQDRGNFGIGLYSKIPLEETDSFSLNMDSILTLAATVRKGDQVYRVIATHPLPPMGAGGFRNRNEHLRLLVNKIRAERKPDDGKSMIVMGDLNLTPWSPLFGRFEEASELSRAGRGHGLTPTWYAYTNASFPFGLVLDHVLISADLECTSHTVGPSIGSDHRAVIVGVSRR
ncbi:MAG: endonuclease/exonuclease/phosphatase family protein [Pirellulaceae bacterium]